MNMTTKRFLIGLAAAILSCSASAATYFETGASLMKGWREHQKIMNSQVGEKNFMLASAFSGYVRGVADTRSEALGVPQGVTGDQICAIVGTYLENHPEEWNDVGSVLVEKALRNAFRRKQ
ncbi:MAG: Rap1a/Tai family immunity protein [Steroidobacteraceae bacterium]